MDDLAMLRLQMAWGADEALDEAPIDRLRPVAPAPAPRPRPVPMERAPPTGTPAERALKAAGLAHSLPALKAAIKTFEGDPLRDMATNLVFATGEETAGLLLIGGAPGADEDRTGTPFAGPEGALLDQMLRSVSLKRESMLLTPLIPWRPPGGRVPNAGEIQLYRPFLMRLLALTVPERIILFGSLTANTVLGPGSRTRTIGWVETAIDGHTTRLLVLPALSEIIKTPARRKDAWAGMRALRRALDG